MIDATESKIRKPKTSSLKKQCIHCGKQKLLSLFLNNKDWTELLGKDVWCKDCLSRCISKELIRLYFWLNNRLFNEDIWTYAEKKAKKIALSSSVYNKSPDDRQRSMLLRLTAQQMPSIVSLKYTYRDNTQRGKIIPYLLAKLKGLIAILKDKNLKTYSKDFNGWFSLTDLLYLLNYYLRLLDDFDLNNLTLRDSARKVSKASLQVDKAMDDYTAGKCDYSVVKDAITVFDTLNKSANFALCKRKPGDSSGNTCWSDTTLYLMKNKKIILTPVQWLEDDVDKVVNLYLHTISAVGLDQA